MKSSIEVHDLPTQACGLYLRFADLCAVRGYGCLDTIWEQMEVRKTEWAQRRMCAKSSEARGHRTQEYVASFVFQHQKRK